MYIHLVQHVVFIMYMIYTISIHVVVCTCCIHVVYYMSYKPQCFDQS